MGGPLSKLCVTPPFSIKFRCQIENQVNDYRLLGSSSFICTKIVSQEKITPSLPPPPPPQIFFIFYFYHICTKIVLQEKSIPLWLYLPILQTYLPISYMTIRVRSMYNFVNCLQFNIRYEKVERPAPVGGALVLNSFCLWRMQAKIIRRSKKHQILIELQLF
jgi:hypothetical protein